MFRNIKSSWLVLLAASFTAMLSACFADTNPYDRVPTPTPCAGQTGDTFACTQDVCNAATNAFVAVPDHASCGAGRSCRPDMPGHDTSGCVGTPAPTCGSDCNDHFDCTFDFCDLSGRCQNIADNQVCGGWELCVPQDSDDATGCWSPPDGPDAGTPPPPVDGGTVPPPGRFCADGQLIGTRIRFSLRDMGGIRSFAGQSISAANAGVILWDFSGDTIQFAPGVTVEQPVEGGVINIHLIDGAFDRYDSRMANLQNVSSATHDVTAEERGITAEVMRDGRWVRLPEGFLYFGDDTQPSVRWGVSPDRSIPTGQRVGRLLQNTECASQFRVYDNGAFRAAR